MQLMWKACLHFGSNLRISSSSNLKRQTAHSRPSFDPLSEENLKNGSASITCLSIPDCLDLDRPIPGLFMSRFRDSLDLILQNLTYARRRNDMANMTVRIAIMAPLLGWKFCGTSSDVPWDFTFNSKERIMMNTVKHSLIFAISCLPNG